MPPDRTAGGFALFGETLLTGLLVTAASVPVVTVLPAIAAGTGHLRRHVTGEMDSLRAFVGDLRAAWRSMWLVSTGAVGVLAVLVLNTAVLWDGAVPGGRPLAAVMAVLAIVVAVTCLRAAAMWPGRLRRGEASSTRWLLRAAAGRARSDLAGSVLVLMALGLCFVLVWMLAVLVVVVPGLLALALVAVEHRHGEGLESPSP